MSLYKGKCEMETSEPNAASILNSLRDSIDNMDAAMVHILAERFRRTHEVGLLKAKYNLPPADPEREAKQFTRLRALAIDAGLEPDFAQRFLSLVIREVVRRHTAVQS
jgi:chorismate mutase